MFSKLGSLLLITGQQTASQGHEQCVVAEQRAFSLESVRLSVRERGEERGGEKLYVVGIDWGSVLGHRVSSGFERL